MNPTEPQTATPTEAPDAGARRYQCRHIFAEGHRCRALSLRQEHFCYNHHTSRNPLPARNPTPAQETLIYPDTAFILPPLEDRASIQLAISELARRIAANQLDMERAKFLLRCCHRATANLPKEPRTAKNAHAAYEEEDEDLTPEPLVEAFELDPILGPLAPIAEAPELPAGRPSTYFEQLLERILDKSNPPCPTCHPTPPPEPPPDAPYPFTLPAIQAVAQERVPRNLPSRCEFPHHPKRQNAPTIAASSRPWGTLLPTNNCFTAPLPRARHSGSGSPRPPCSRRSCRPRSSLSAPR